MSPSDTVSISYPTGGSNRDTAVARRYTEDLPFRGDRRAPTVGRIADTGAVSVSLRAMNASTSLTKALATDNPARTPAVDFVLWDAEEQPLAISTARAFAELNRHLWDDPEEDAAWADL